MKKLLTLITFLCISTYGFTEEKPLELTVKGVKPGRTLSQLPTATIDGQILTIDFTSSTTFEVQVTDASGTVVYMGIYSVQHAIVTLPQLSEGIYKLTIEDSTYIYSGDFDIEA